MSTFLDDLLGEFVSLGAVADGPYRYLLWRLWDRGRDPVVFLMLNPSTADDVDDDPTIRKCRGFARRWGAGGIIVANLFAFSTKSPDVLRREAASRGIDGIDFVVGPRNLEYWRYLLDVPRVALVAAWGRNAAGALAPPEDQLALLRACDDVVSLGRCQNGQPCHPLRLPYATKREEWQ